MKVKLIKHGYSYAILNGAHLAAFAHTEDFDNDNIIGKLSIKNCEAIANGYDLKELGYEYYTSNEHYTVEDSIHFIKGMKKMIEILGDKKFSEEDVRKAFFHVQNEPTFDVFKKSLQQTEWEVIVEMKDRAEKVSIEKARSTQFSIERAVNAIDEAWFPKPKLDADGCLILRKI